MLRGEFTRGREVTFKIEHNGESWAKLFEKTDFFDRYKIYVQIDVMADTEVNQRKWYLSFQLHYYM